MMLACLGFLPVPEPAAGRLCVHSVAQPQRCPSFLSNEKARRMYQPEAYAVALVFMIGSMLCWGSWANTMKLTPGYPFQLFYWDYIIGIIVASLFWGHTLGSMNGGPSSFINNIHSADTRHVLFAIAGGAVFNVANLLLVAAIEIAGLAVAFPIGIGL